jgi:ribosomal protein S18 acetylase RimI-like enzyme
VSVSIRFAPFSAADFHAWLIEAIPSFALTNVEDGRWTLAESIEKSQQAHAELLPQGLHTPGQFFVNLHDAGSGERVGMLWWAEAARAGTLQGFIYNITIDEQARSRGYARAALLELEGVARAHGVRQLSLHVFGHNHGARRLYESLGFEPASLTLRKVLS